MSIKIASCHTAYESERLNRPFGFKGNYLREVWQVVFGMESAAGNRSCAVSAQSVLWTDPAVFAGHSQVEGNQLMYALTRHAAKLCEGMEFETPPDLLEQILEPTWEFGRSLTGRPDLQEAFVLNALTGLDTAAWKLYAQEQGLDTFDEMIPAEYRHLLREHHQEVACIPLITHGIPVDEIQMYADMDYFLMRIRLGGDPDRDGNLDKMLAWDMKRIDNLHQVLKDYETPFTDRGWMPYYLDLNGRYDSRDRLERLLEHFDRIGALERVALLSDPFPMNSEIRVEGLGVRIVANDCVQSDLEVVKRAALGYGAVALKPGAKTLSMTLRMMKVAEMAGLPMFCSDHNVGPIQVDNCKCLACRLPPLPGIRIGVLETTGRQNYRCWEKLRGYHPRGFATWTDVHRGCFHLDEDFYARSAGILEESRHYAALVFDR